jgi:calcium-translocating P-type ATPase
MQFNFQGLTDEQVEQSRTKHGSNAVTLQVIESFWSKLLGNFQDPIIIILIVALFITAGLAILGYAEWYEGVGIALAVVIATLVATLSEYKNEAAFQKLLEEASLIQVKVFRNSKLVEISINELVVGDYLLLQPGDTVPADGYLVAGHADVNEAALTGESEAVKKVALMNEQDEVHKHNAIERACLIEDGETVIKITAVGDKTQYGKTLKDVVSAEDRLSPLQNKLTLLGQQITQFAYLGAVGIALTFMYKHIFLDVGSLDAYLQLPTAVIISHVVKALILAIIIIVVAVPEGLPMMIAIVLSLNMRKLLQAKVLVRKLLGIETAGSLTILFTDKTGTLTQGKLSVAEFISGDLQHFTNFAQLPTRLQNKMAFALRNNTSAVIDASDIANPRLVGADRTEQALLHCLGELLAIKDKIDIVDLIPFNSARKFSAIEVVNGEKQTLVKGAPEVVLQNCLYGLDAAGEKMPLDKEALLLEMKTLSDRAMRLIAVAITDNPIHEDKSLPTELILLGILGLRDDLRTTAYQSVQRAKQAGIHVVMITGDAKDTARAIGKDVGLISDENSIVLTSSELAELSDAQVKDMLPNLYVVSRAYPTDKSRLVKLTKELGWVAGMTGDGVNDAPAIKHADVGFAMGSGTEMTKEASDIVVLDDNFYSITQAVLYGRTLFKSIRKFLVFQLTVSLSAILIAFLGPFLGFDLPLTMVQLLWINLIMDTLAALAFSGEAALERYMQEKPISREASLITPEMWAAIFTNGIISCGLSILFLTNTDIRASFSSEAAFLTGFFAFFAFIHSFNTFNARTESLNLFSHLSDNKNFIYVLAFIFAVQILFTYIGGQILRTVPLSLEEWMYPFGLAVLIIPVDLIRKLIRNLVFGNPIKA